MMMRMQFFGDCRIIKQRYTTCIGGKYHVLECQMTLFVQEQAQPRVCLFPVLFNWYKAQCQYMIECLWHHTKKWMSSHVAQGACKDHDMMGGEWL